MRWSRSSFGGTPVCSSWTATAPTPTVWSWSAGSRATPSPPSFPSPPSPPTTTRNRSRPGFQPARTRSSVASSRRPSSAPDWTPCWSAPSGTSRSTRRRGCPAPPRSNGRSGGGSSPTQEFAVCYADLDHFKEFNDRYSYYDGDRVIYLLSRILHDVVKGLLGARGFVGHIGGDDFIFIIPSAEISAVCERDPGRLRHAHSAAVQRPGPPGGVLLRQGSPGPAAPGAAHDAVHRHRDQPAPSVCASGAGQRACHRDEELREDAARARSSWWIGGRAPTAKIGKARVSGNSREDAEMNVTCPNCATTYRVDPAKVPEAGVRARCAVCSAVFAVSREAQRGQAAGRATARRPPAGRRGPRDVAPPPPQRHAAAPPRLLCPTPPAPRPEPPRVEAPPAPAPRMPPPPQVRGPWRFRRRRPSQRPPPRPDRRPPRSRCRHPRSAHTGTRGGARRCPPTAHRQALGQSIPFSPRTRRSRPSGSPGRSSRTWSCITRPNGRKGFGMGT